MHAPPELPDANLKAAHFYLLSAAAACPQCRYETRVFALAVPAKHQWLHLGEEDEEDRWQSGDAPAVLFHIAALNVAAALRLRDLAPGFRPSAVSGTSASGWVNHCGQCEEELQDDDLHCEPGATFLPVSPAAARMLRFTEIQEALQVNAAAWDPGAHWLAHATRG